MATILSASPHCTYGPIRSVGAVSVRSARWPRGRLPAATASARYTPYEPECVPITLRWLRLTVVPTIGPRSSAVGAPHWIAGARLGPWPGWEVRRMCLPPGVSEPMDCAASGGRAPIGLQPQAHVHVVVQRAVHADRGGLAAVHDEAERLVQRHRAGVGGIGGEVQLADAVGAARERDHGFEQAARQAASTMRLGHEHAPHEALVLQLAPLLAG